MSKLYFYYGVMGSSKTANALMNKFSYEERGKKVLLLKPAVDTRDGETVVKSRVGISATAKVIGNNDELFPIIRELDPDVVIVDECQFLTEEQVKELRGIVDFLDKTVYCYGLRTDFQTKLFEGSAALMALADTINEIKVTCKCGRKAIINARIKNGKIITEGAQIEIGGSDKYVAMCSKCYGKI